MEPAINHIVSPKQPLAAVFSMAGSLGLADVAIRNDLEGAPILNGASPAAVKEAARNAGVGIVSIKRTARSMSGHPRLPTKPAYAQIAPRRRARA